MQKNTASQQFTVFAFDLTDNTPKTGDAAQITATISKDFAADVATNDVNPTETQGGFYVFDGLQAETNADAIQIFPSSSTADIQVISVPGVIFTNPVSFGDDIIQTGDHTAGIADIPTVAEFNARTLVAASYATPTNITAATGVVLSPVTHTGAVIPNVTLTATCTDVTNLHASAATSAAQTTAQNDLDVLTGTDGATLATAQANYAPNKVIPDVAGTAATPANVATELATYDSPTNAEMEARTPTAAQLAYIVSNSADGKPVTFTSGTTTTAVLALVDGSTPSSVDDFYNGRVLIFNGSTLADQATDITDYDGATFTAIFTAVTTAVTSSHTANMK